MEDHVGLRGPDAPGPFFNASPRRPPTRPLSWAHQTYAVLYSYSVRTDCIEFIIFMRRACVPCSIIIITTTTTTTVEYSSFFRCIFLFFPSSRNDDDDQIESRPVRPPTALISSSRARAHTLTHTHCKLYDGDARTTTASLKSSLCNKLRCKAYGKTVAKIWRRTAVKRPSTLDERFFFTFNYYQL